MTKVVLVRAESYDVDVVRRAVTRGMDLLGGAGKFARPGQKVLLKPNLLVGEIPDKCVTTHPARKPISLNDGRRSTLLSQPHRPLLFDAKYPLKSKKSPLYFDTLKAMSYQMAL